MLKMRRRHFTPSLPGLTQQTILFRKKMDARVKCLVRGHGRHLFGDITDTFAGQVNVSDPVGAEEDAVLAVGGQRPDGDALAATP